MTDTPGTGHNSEPAGDLKAHPIAEIFPLMQGAAFDEFVADIKTHGLREPIALFEGKVLDGRNRLRACRAAGVAVSTFEFSGGDPIEYVVSKNLRRRHLKDSQRALIAARLANVPWGRRPKRESHMTSRSEAAQLLNVKIRTLDWGRQVERHATPELRQLVEGGHLSVSAAGKIAKLPRKQQALLVKKGPSAIVAEARKIHGQRGRQGRSEYSLLWGKVDEICAGLEARRLDKAQIAARQFVREIDRISQERRGK